MLQLLCVCVSDCYGHQVCQAETPHEVLRSDPGSAGQVKGDCKVVVSGLLCGKPVKWEVLFDIRPYLSGREREEKVHEELWNETFHYLAGRSIIQDFEHMAEKEREIEHGEAVMGQRGKMTGFTGVMTYSEIFYMLMTFSMIDSFGEEVPALRCADQ